MIGLIQRVTQAAVEIDGAKVAEIAAGIMLLLGVEKGDDQQKADRLLPGPSHMKLAKLS